MKKSGAPPADLVASDPAERLFGGGAPRELDLARCEAGVDAERIRSPQLGLTIARLVDLTDRPGVDDAAPVALAEQRRRARHETGGKISSRSSPSANGRPNGTTSVWARSRSPAGPSSASVASVARI